MNLRFKVFSQKKQTVQFKNNVPFIHVLSVQVSCFTNILKSYKVKNTCMNKAYTFHLRIFHPFSMTAIAYIQLSTAEDYLTDGYLIFSINYYNSGR